MTHRERVLAALNHREGDRVPIDFSGHHSSGIAAIAYAKLRSYLGLPQRPVRVQEPKQQIAIVDEDVLDLFSVDVTELGRAFAPEDEDWTDWVLPDGTPCQIPVWIKPERDGARWIIRSATGRAIAQTWPPLPQVAIYTLVIAGAVRFIHYSLFDGTLLSLHYYLVDSVVLLGLSLIGFRAARVAQMVSQYRWINEPDGPMRWRRRRG